MEIETKFALKLLFANPSFVQIFFEAIANAIDAEATRIEVGIDTDGRVHGLGHLEIVIRDNGIGFTDERYEQFRRLKEPRDAFHKGLGRLVYLQYFEEVRVRSAFAPGRVREFAFVDNFGGECDVSDFPAEPVGSELRFRRFRGRRIKSYDDLSPRSLRQAILEQFLPVLLQRKREGRAVEIVIRLHTEEENRAKGFFSGDAILDRSSLPDLASTTIQDQDLGLFGSVGVHYAIQRDQGANPLLLTAAVVDGRTIPLELVPATAVPPGTSVVFLFESEMFDGRSDSARQRLVLPEGLTEARLYRVLRQEVARILAEQMPEIRARNEKVRADFEERLPHLIGLFDQDTVGLIDKDEAIEGAQLRFLRQQREVLEAPPSSDAAFEKSLEVSARSLTEYILYRDWIVRRLAATPSAEHEASIHDLIAPKGARFEGDVLVGDIYRNNVWILDDKFMTFRTILSEAKMSEVIAAITLDDECRDEGRPDISMIFSADPDSKQGVDVVVVELKRRKLDAKEATFAGVQLVKRARKLVEYCPNIQRVWYYGIVEIDEALGQLLMDLKYVPLFSKSRVYYQEFRVGDVPAPTFLLSFKAVAEDAAARNHAFLEILKNSFRNAELAGAAGATPSGKTPEPVAAASSP